MPKLSTTYAGKTYTRETEREYKYLSIATAGEQENVKYHATLAAARRAPLFKAHKRNAQGEVIYRMRLGYLQPVKVPCGAKVVIEIATGKVVEREVA